MIAKKLQAEKRTEKQAIEQQNAITNVSNLKNLEIITKRRQLLETLRKEVKLKINSHIYKVKRNEFLDHEEGRPAILVMKKGNKALVCLGFSENEEQSNALCLSLKAGKTTYFKKFVSIDSEKVKELWIGDYILSSNDKTNICELLTENNLKEIFPKAFAEQEASIKLLEAMTEPCIPEPSDGTILTETKHSSEQAQKVVDTSGMTEYFESKIDMSLASHEQKEANTTAKAKIVQKPIRNLNKSRISGNGNGKQPVVSLLFANNNETKSMSNSESNSKSYQKQLNYLTKSNDLSFS